MNCFGFGTTFSLPVMLDLSNLTPESTSAAAALSAATKSDASALTSPEAGSAARLVASEGQGVTEGTAAKQCVSSAEIKQPDRPKLSPSEESSDIARASGNSQGVRHHNNTLQGGSLADEPSSSEPDLQQSSSASDATASCQSS